MDMIDGRPRAGWGWLRYLGWGIAAALLLAPAAAMRFAPGSGVNWTGSDFVFAAIMFGILGLGLELTVRASSNWKYRAAAAIALGTGFLLIWANLAVGYIGDGGSPINLVFLALPLLGLIGGMLVRFRAARMAWVMSGVGLAHAITGAIGFPMDTRTGTGPISIAFTALWLTSALLFGKASRGSGN